MSAIAIGGIIVLTLQGVGVDRLGRSYVRVTQNLLGSLRRHSRFGHQGTCQVPQIVEAHRRKACLAAGPTAPMASKQGCGPLTIVKIGSPAWWSGRNTNTRL